MVGVDVREQDVGDLVRADAGERGCVGKPAAVSQTEEVAGTVSTRTLRS
jgi:hypothetical protein